MKDGTNYLLGAIVVVLIANTIFDVLWRFEVERRLDAQDGVIEYRREVIENMEWKLEKLQDEVTKWN